GPRSARGGARAHPARLWRLAGGMRAHTDRRPSDRISPRKQDLPEHEKLRADVERRTSEQLRRVLPRVDVVHSHGFDLVDFQDFPNLTTLHAPIDFKHLAFYLERKNLSTCRSRGTNRARYTADSRAADEATKREPRDLRAPARKRSSHSASEATRAHAAQRSRAPDRRTRDE